MIAACGDKLKWEDIEELKYFGIFKDETIKKIQIIQFSYKVAFSSCPSIFP